jgi:hypothetical protein
MWKMPERQTGSAGTNDRPGRTPPGRRLREKGWTCRALVRQPPVSLPRPPGRHPGYGWGCRSRPSPLAHWGSAGPPPGVSLPALCFLPANPGQPRERGVCVAQFVFLGVARPGTPQGSQFLGRSQVDRGRLTAKPLEIVDAARCTSSRPLGLSPAVPLTPCCFFGQVREWEGIIRILP